MIYTHQAWFYAETVDILNTQLNSNNELLKLLMLMHLNTVPLWVKKSRNEFTHF